MHIHTLNGSNSPCGFSRPKAYVFLTFMHVIMRVCADHPGVQLQLQPDGAHGWLPDQHQPHLAHALQSAHEGGPVQGRDHCTMHTLWHTRTHCITHLYTLQHTPVHTASHTCTHCRANLYTLHHTPVHIAAQTYTHCITHLYALQHTPVHTASHTCTHCITHLYTLHHTPVHIAVHTCTHCITHPYTAQHTHCHSQLTCGHTEYTLGPNWCIHFHTPHTLSHLAWYWACTLSHLTQTFAVGCGLLPVH